MAQTGNYDGDDLFMVGLRVKLRRDPYGSMYPNSIYLSPKVPIQGRLEPKVYILMSWVHGPLYSKPYIKL